MKLTNKKLLKFTDMTGTTRKTNNFLLIYIKTLLICLFDEISQKLKYVLPCYPISLLDFQIFRSALWQRFQLSFENGHGENRRIKSPATLKSERGTEFNVSNFARSSPNLIRRPKSPLSAPLRLASLFPCLRNKRSSRFC